MDKIKLLHIADAHLGASYSNLPYEKANIRKNEAIYTFIKAINSAKSCDLVLISGDVFESGDVPTSIADSVLASIANLGKIPVFFACGNHDPYCSNIIRYCLKNAPTNLKIFAPDKISSYEIEDKKIRVFGASFSSSVCSESMIDTMPSCDDSYINLLCMHADNIKGIYNYLDIDKLSQKQIDYAALGHIHSFSKICKARNSYYAYSGICEGRGFDECGPKGYISGYLSKEECMLEFVYASKRIYVDEKIDISDFTDEYELVDVIRTVCDNPDNIYRIDLIGDNRLENSINTKFIEEQIDAFSFECTDSTVPATEIEDYVSMAGLKGMCAKKTLELIESTNDIDMQNKYKKAFLLLKNMFGE